MKQTADRARNALSIAELVAMLERHGFACRCQALPDQVVSGLAYDSRAVAAGDLFLALPGTRTDGMRFIADAMRAGAVAVVCGQDVAAGDTPHVVVDDVGRAAGFIASTVYGDPAGRMRMVGVTGTNGKTSCTYLLESVWQAADEAVGVLGTVSQRWPGCERAASMTTPPAVDIHRALADMAAAGCTWVAMEVSSHALSQYRVAGCSFDAAIFTNLTRDHLDYHGDEESYFAAKARLFLDHLKDGDGVAVLNADDPYGMRLAGMLGSHRCRTYSAAGAGGADVVPVEIEASLDGIRGRVAVGDKHVRLQTPLVGAPNLANILAVVAASEALGVPIEAIERGVNSCAPVPGRLERIGEGRPAVLVDYAHTPDALERTLQALGPQTRGRLIVVFGCGGDRDRGKRPMMGAIAGCHADVSVLTSDNPRSEDPAAIIDGIEEGIAPLASALAFDALADSGARGYLVEADRERAIEAALSLAGADDVVVVAGKGHEDYQEIAGRRHPFDDRVVVRRLQGAQ